LGKNSFTPDQLTEVHTIARNVPRNVQRVEMKRKPFREGGEGNREAMLHRSEEDMTLREHMHNLWQEERKLDG